MKINDPDFGPLDYDDDLEAWTGRLQTSCFAHCGMKWDLSPAGSLGQRHSDEGDPQGSPKSVEIVVADAGKRKGPGPQQRAALAAFRGDEQRICATVLAEVARVARDRYVTADQLPADAPALTSQRKTAERLCSPEGVSEWLDRPRIDFHATGEGGVSYTSFNFNAGFDIEHGVGILMLKNQVREVGGSSEFYDY